MENGALHNSAYNYLFNEICSGHMAPGTPIVEQAISSTLQISRTPVREAIKRLEAEHLVEHIPYRGSFVASLTIQDIMEIYEIRKLFEVASVDSAVQNITDAELDAVYEPMEALSIESPAQDFYECDRSLHALLLLYNYNRRMIYFYNTISAQVEQVRRLSSYSPARLMTSRQEHLDILNCLRARDAEATRSALSLHMDHIAQTAINVYQKNRMESEGLGPAPALWKEQWPRL